MLKTQIFTVFLLLLLTLTFNSLVFADPIPSEDINQQDIINFINEVKGNTDTTVSPCDDFLKYACGKMKHEENNDKSKELKVINRVFNLEEPKTKMEKVIQEQLLTGKKLEENPDDFVFAHELIKEIDFLKSLGSFPVQQTAELSSKTVAEFEAQANSLLLGSFFIVALFYNETIEIHVNYRIFDDNKIKQILYILKDPNMNTTEADKVIDNVIEFENNLKELNIRRPTGETIEVESIEEFKKLFPSKNFDWDIFFETMEKLWPHKTNIKYKYRVRNDDYIADLIKIIDTTDIQTIINYQVYLYIRYWKTELNRLLIPLANQLPAFRHIWDENLSEITVRKYTNFLNEFEVILNKTLISIPDSDSDDVENNLDLRRNILANHTKLIPHEEIEEIFKDYDFNKPYLSKVKLFQKLFGFLFYGPFDGNEDLFVNVYKELIESDIKNKPYFYYYKIINFDLWTKYFLYNNISESKISKIETCFKQIPGNKDLTIHDVETILGLYASLKSTINFENSNSKLENEIKFIKNLIEPDQLFFTSLTQYNCERYNYRISKENLLTAFSFSEEFSKTFSCPINSKMNHYKTQCDLDVCDKFFPYRQDLIPITIRCTQ